jgi:DNA-binding NarL/FixJ family response regulator
MRVVLAEDNYLVREGVRSLLESSGRVNIVAAVGDGEALLSAVEEHRPDVVVTDIRMPPGHQLEGIEAARLIRSRHPHTGVVVLSQHADAAYAMMLLAEGGEGCSYLLKDRVADLGQLLFALDETSRGRSVIDPVVVQTLIASRAQTASSPLRGLTERERKVLSLMAEGLDNKAIGTTLFLSESGVSKHISSIFTKLGLPEEDGVHRRVMAVLTYLHHVT